MTIYEHKSVERYIFEKLVPMGYEIHIFPGALVDSFICVAPDDKHYNFIFWEKYINEWSSGLTQRKCRKLPKWALELIEQESSGDPEAA